MAQLLDFTNRNIAKLEAPATGRAEYKDKQEQGLYLRVTAKGAMSFSFVGRAKGSARVERLTLGKYRVVWRALSVDTHVSEGDFTFEVKP